MEGLEGDDLNDDKDRIKALNPETSWSDQS